MDFQRYSDGFLERTLLPFIPRGLSPNQVSWLRIISIPFIYLLLQQQQFTAGFMLFVIAALTDALDGAMARTRDQVTETGKILDAVADRGLIALVALVFIPKYYGWALLATLAALEAFNAAMAYRSRRKIGMNPGANWAGKVKMFLQCVAFGMIFVGLFSEGPHWVTYALPLLEASLFFALIQSFLYPQDVRGLGPAYSRVH